MGKLHKDIALAMVQLTEAEGATSQHAIKVPVYTCYVIY